MMAVGEPPGRGLRQARTGLPGWLVAVAWAAGGLGGTALTAEAVWTGSGETGPGAPDRSILVGDALCSGDWAATPLD